MLPSFSTKPNEHVGSSTYSSQPYSSCPSILLSQNGQFGSSTYSSQPYWSCSFYTTPNGHIGSSTFRRSPTEAALPILCQTDTLAPLLSPLLPPDSYLLGKCYELSYIWSRSAGKNESLKKIESGSSELETLISRILRPLLLKRNKISIGR